MIIKSIRVEKFRAMENVELRIGKRITAIAGRNATMKTTLLGMLGQPFSISKDSPLYGEHTIDGYNYRSQFKEKFKLSQKHDVAGEHKWTLQFVNQSFYHNNYIEMVSTNRTARGTSSSIRFINAEGKSKGKGYVQLPVVYLSLSRIYPIGEAGTTKEVPFELSEVETKLYTEWYRKILSIQDQSELSVCIEKHDSKRVFAGVSDNVHDLQTNSAGEGNIGRILVSVLSFRRLKEQHPEYRGGILLIDELDATLYGFSQIKLVEFLKDVSEKYGIQIIFTTHSPLVLETVNKFQRTEIKDKHVPADKYCYDCEIILLSPQYINDRRMVSGKNIHTALELKKTIDNINLNPTRIPQSINVYFEDDRAFSLFEFLMKKHMVDATQYFKCIEGVNLGWTNYLQLHSREVPEFLNSIIILDHDVQSMKEYKKKWERYVEKAGNILFFPVDVEQGMFRMLKDHANYDLFEKKLNEKQISMSYDVCFRDWPNSECDCTEEYKAWFEFVEQSYDVRLLFETWYDINKTDANKFVEEFLTVYNNMAESQGLDYLFPCGDITTEGD